MDAEQAGAGLENLGITLNHAATKTWGGDRVDEMSLDQEARSWPTPNALISNDGESPESWEARRQVNIAKGYNGNGQGTPLTIAATAWPTPNSRDHKGEDMPGRNGGASLSHATQTGEFSHSSPQALKTPTGPESSPSTPTLRRRLNPAFVCLLMGWPWWWTRAEPTSFGAAEMELFHSRLLARLSSLCGGR